MNQTAIEILSALAFLNIKHLIADFFLQTPYQYQNKGKYGHPGGLLHGFIHIVCSAPVFFIIIPSGIIIAGLILLAEFFLHYHIDWLKTNIIKWNCWTTKVKAYWYAIGIDQTSHHLTYIGMITALLFY